MIDEDLGYYLCNNIKFVSKIDSIIYSYTVKKPVEWIFHNDIFSKHSWHIEPENTLDFYYDQRARELREKYDYIILSYSGGSDTHNIFESFARQGLVIDEIVTNHMTSATKKMTVLDSSITNSWNFAAEHELNAVHRIKYISQVSPKTKITVLDVSDVIFDSMKSFENPNWVLGRNDHLSIGQLFRYNYFHFGNLKKQLDKNLKVCIIVGLEKPKTVIINQKLYVSFTDTVANITTINDFNSDYTNTKVEMFYWSKNALDLMTKQVHTIKKFLENKPQFISFWKPMVNINGKIFNAVDINRIFKEKILRQVIYTTWNDNWFQTDKSLYWWNTEFDNWFRNDPTLRTEYSMWKNGLEFLKSKIPEHVHYKNGVIDRLIPYSHNYCVGNIIGA